MIWSYLYRWVLGFSIALCALPASAAFLSVRGPDFVSPGELFRVDVLFIMTEDANASLGKGIGAVDVQLVVENGLWVDISSRSSGGTLPCDSEFCDRFFGPNNQLRGPNGNSRPTTDAPRAYFTGSALGPTQFDKRDGEELFIGHGLIRAGDVGPLNIAIADDFLYALSASGQNGNITSDSPTNGDIVKIVTVPEPSPSLLALLCLGAVLATRVRGHRVRGHRVWRLQGDR